MLLKSYLSPRRALLLKGNDHQAVVRELVEADVRAANVKLETYQQVKKFALLAEEFSSGWTGAEWEIGPLGVNALRSRPESPTAGTRNRRSFRSDSSWTGARCSRA